MKLINIYNKLLEKYNYQGWWPLNNYHPNDYTLPTNNNEIFEICIGAILAQNTNWNNVKKAINNLKQKNLLNCEKLLDCKIGELKNCIKPAGYFNQKANYLLNFAKRFNQLTPTREELLNIKGIGKETADSILLYAYKKPIFVVDTYTRRIFSNLGLIKKKDPYDRIRLYFEYNLPKDYKLFQEFHALIVKHAKNYYVKKPYGTFDFLKK